MALIYLGLKSPFKQKIKNHLPITPSCCGDSGAASPPPEPIEPEARDNRSLKPSGLLRPPLLATDPIPERGYFNAISSLL